MQLVVSHLVLHFRLSGILCMDLVNIQDEHEEFSYIHEVVVKSGFMGVFTPENVAW